jgi:hypothetical protein
MSKGPKDSFGELLGRTPLENADQEALPDFAFLCFESWWQKSGLIRAKRLIKAIRSEISNQQAAIRQVAATR